MPKPDWFRQKVSQVLGEVRQKAPAEAAENVALRSTTERMQASLRQAGEALSPRELRQKLEELRAVVDTRISEVELSCTR